MTKILEVLNSKDVGGDLKIEVIIDEPYKAN